MGVSTLQPVLTRFTQVSRVNSERMRANVIEAAEQCGILGIADVAEPVAFDRFSSHRKSQRLLVFCDEAADVANPLKMLSGEKATDGNRHPDRARRRVCRGGARRPVASAKHPCGFRSAPESCGRIPRASRHWLWFRPRSAIGPRILRLKFQLTTCRPALLVKSLGRSRSKPRARHAKGLRPAPGQRLAIFGPAESRSINIQLRQWLRYLIGASEPAFRGIWTAR